MPIIYEKSAHYQVKGVDLDENTRCLHYHSPMDVVAIKMKCCGTYYACIDCHREAAGHSAKVWPREEWNQNAVLCGVCGVEMSVMQYKNSGNQCPNCQAAFNPKCRNHYHLYFESETGSGNDSR